LCHVDTTAGAPELPRLRPASFTLNLYMQQRRGDVKAAMELEWFEQTKGRYAVGGMDGWSGMPKAPSSDPRPRGRHHAGMAETASSMREEKRQRRHGLDSVGACRAPQLARAGRFSVQPSQPLQHLRFLP
jgi:hypothetical protein